MAKCCECGKEIEEGLTWCEKCFTEGDLTKIPEGN